MQRRDISGGEGSREQQGHGSKCWQEGRVNKVLVSAWDDSRGKGESGSRAGHRDRVTQSCCSDPCSAHCCCSCRGRCSAAQAGLPGQAASGPGRLRRPFHRQLYRNVSFFLVPWHGSLPRSATPTVMVQLP